jgi:threonine aldolase
VIDFRSDFCAPPTEEMWEAMRSAPFGWATVGEDETVAELERRSAALLGKEASVFVATCSQANAAAVLALGKPGERVSIAPDAHIVVNEGGWLTEIAGLVPVPLGDPAPVLCLENTRTRAGGTILTPAEASALAAGAERVHLDGARLPNAAVALGVSLADLAGSADTVALSLNKGLCAPVGAIMAGSAEIVFRARAHVRRLGGGTIHKAGILAAAGVVALGLVDRLADDHRRAKHLAALLGLPEPETNILMTRLDASALPRLAGVGVLALAPDGRRVRLVTHRGIDDRQIEEAAAAILSL